MQAKLAIVTWITYHNFGTFLQAYALQQVIRTLGYENVILSDKRLVNEITPKVNPFRKVLSYVYHLLIDHWGLNKNLRDASDAYESFKDNYLRIDNTWNSDQDLNDHYDIFVCGSDQIWSPVIPLQAYYYLAFTNKKKIAYAPSIGQTSYPETRKEIVKDLLEDFSALSIRERQGASLLREFVDKPVETVMDPTLLLPSEQWCQLIGHSKVDIPYVLCYLLTFNPFYLDCVKRFAENHHMRLKLFVLDKRYLSYAEIPVFAGPVEFLREIRGASYFFTDSFHGTVFAIHFEKWFRVFKRFDEGASNNQNSRIENLLGICGLLDYFIGKSQFDKIEMLPLVDYQRVKQSLEREREHSLAYLKHALETER